MVMADLLKGGASLKRKSSVSWMKRRLAAVESNQINQWLMAVDEADEDETIALAAAQRKVYKRPYFE